MILSGSYANGFAPRDGRPLYPELWRGCVGAWAPCLGPTGLTLRDWSGFGNHGTLTGGPSWGVAIGRQALNLDGVDDYISGPAMGQSGWSEVSVIAWIRLTSNATVQTFAPLQQSAGSRYTLGWSWQNPNFYSFATAADGSQEIADYNVSNLPSAGKWTHYAYTVKFGEQGKLYIDGQPVVTSRAGTANASTIRTGGSIVMGADITGIRYVSGSFSGTTIHKSVLSPSVIKLLATRPGIAYELAPRRRSRVSVQFNRRRRLLL